MKRDEIKKNTEEKILTFITKYYEQNGYCPTIREISKATGINSTSTIHNYLLSLNDSGKIIKNSSKNRAITINQPKSISAPLLGEIAAGKPILAQESFDEVLSLPQNVFSGDNLFALKVRGDSMIEAGIFDGDTIILQKQNTAENGEIIAALVDGENATVKRFYKERDFVRLKPENSSMSDIICKNVTILGKVVGLIRSI